MSRIKKLPLSVSNKIAAGEVIERPAAIVKELFENSVDAGSSRIELRIADGGREFVQVIDDGCGMSREDALLALERFSTSKITSFEELEHLNTLGFRGEALSSIAAVSVMEIKTKSESESDGTFIRAEGGEIKSSKAVPWSRGTVVTVKNIFYNTPARRKFQKNALSETRQIYRIFRYFALAYPELRLSLYNADRSVWILDPSDLSQRIGDLFDPGIKHNLIAVSGEDSQFSVSGYVSVPEWTRSTRNDQYFFLNKRFIKNRAVEHGVRLGYGETLNHSTGHPFYVLMFSTAPDRYDINIHPTKLEARFQDERGLHHFLSQTVRSALGATQFSTASPSPPHSRVLSGDNQGTYYPEVHPLEKLHETVKPDLGSNTRQDIFSTDRRQDEQHQPASLEKVWQVHRCYIFSQVKSGVIIIDQHTAHERILYEKAIRMLNKEETPSQQLLFPQTVILDKDEMIVLNELQAHLTRLGFDIRIFGEDTAVIEAVPAEVRLGRENDVLKNIIKEYQKDEYRDHDIHDRLAKSFACRSAIMKGDKLTTEEMYNLIDDLFATEFPFYCPHGRPTIIDMSLKDLNARFHR